MSYGEIGRDAKGGFIARASLIESTEKFEGIALEKQPAARWERGAVRGQTGNWRSGVGARACAGKVYARSTDTVARLCGE
eukprot:scaffold90697_cov31-Tisochrysis_lutea.AAC.4